MKLEPQVISMESLLTLSTIQIPHYQRPYKWTGKNVLQLLDDILTFKEIPAYRLGTIVFHLDEHGKHNIVDGQQRMITFLLIDLALQEKHPLYSNVKKENPQLPDLALVKELRFDNQHSKRNIRDNYREIVQRIRDFDKDTILFFYKNCQVVTVVLDDISEAFQFFDAQNTRGVDLKPHDLLKAFHLREIPKSITEKEQTEIVANWENVKSDELHGTFAYFLFRIRNWMNGKSARYFSKNDVDLFKGISLKDEFPYPFAKPYKIIDQYSDNQQRTDSLIVQENSPFPFQLDQVIINGKRFFEMVHHYQKAIDQVHKGINTNGNAQKILDTLDKYEGRNRTGDRYVHNLFKCAVIFYLDKFETVELDRVIERLFIWAYNIRLCYTNVQLATVDNYTIHTSNMFKVIKEAIRPTDVLNIQLVSINKSDIKGTKIEDLITIFTELSYIYEH